MTLAPLLLAPVSLSYSGAEETRPRSWSVTSASCSSFQKKKKKKNPSYYNSPDPATAAPHHTPVIAATAGYYYKIPELTTKLSDKVMDSTLPRCWSTPYSPWFATAPLLLPVGSSSMAPASQPAMEAACSLDPMQTRTWETDRSKRKRKEKLKELVWSCNNNATLANWHLLQLCTWRLHQFLCCSRPHESYQKQQAAAAAAKALPTGFFVSPSDNPSLEEEEKEAAPPPLPLLSKFFLVQLLLLLLLRPL